MVLRPLLASYGDMKPFQEDVAGTGEEAFDVGMRHHFISYEVADEDMDERLNFDEYCKLVREREDFEFTEEQLRERFKLLDLNGNGYIEMNEYLRYALRDALARSASRVIEVFQVFDEDGSGQIDRHEFRKAVKALGFVDIRDAEIDKVFDDFDEDESGELDYRELNKKLRQFAGLEVEQRYKLRRRAGGKRGAALSTAIKVDHTSDVPMEAQLRKILAKNAVRVVDIFHSWDEDGNGIIEKQEFYQAMAILTTGATRDDFDRLFDVFDADGSGTIEYSELNKLLRRAAGGEFKGAGQGKKRSRGAKYVSEVKYSPRFDAFGPRSLNASSASLRTGMGRGIDQAGRTVSLPALDSRFYATSIKHFDQQWIMPAHGQGWLRTASSKPRGMPSKGLPPNLKLPPLPHGRGVM